MNTILEQINSAGGAFVDFALPMLVQSGILILILLLIDFLLRRKVRAVFRYWIWMLVLAKLVLPTSLASPLSIGYLFGDRLTSLQVVPTLPQTVEQSPIVTTPIIDLSSIPTGKHTTPTMPTRPSDEPILSKPLTSSPVSPAPISWQGVVFLLWLSIVIAMGLLLLQRAVFVKGLVAQAEEADTSIKDTFDSCCKRIGIRKRIGLKISVNATSPAVCGLFRPVILLPHNLSQNLSTGQLQAVLLHELAHIKRGDLWINTVQTALQIIYLYNPLLWLANAIIRRVREQAVDEIVLVAMGPKAQQYTETLLNVAKLAFARPALSLRLIGVIESKNQLKERIRKMLERPVPERAKLGIVGMLVVFALGAFLLPMAKANKSAADTPAVSEKPKTETEAELKMLQDQIVQLEKQLQRIEKQIQQKKSQIAEVETKVKEQSALIKKDKQGAGKDKEKPKVTKEKAPAKEQSALIKKDKQGAGKDKEEPKVTKEKAPAKEQSALIKKDKQGAGKDKEKPSRSK